MDTLKANLRLACGAGILVFPPRGAAQALLTVDSPEAMSSAGEMIASRYIRIQQTEVTLFERADSGHPPDTQTVSCWHLIDFLLCRAWSKLDVQVLVCNCVGDPFKAWVAGSNPAAHQFQPRINRPSSRGPLFCPQVLPTEVPRHHSKL